MKRNWERAVGIVPLGEEALTRLIQPRFPGCRVEQANPISAGLSNTNYRLKITGRLLPIRLRLFVTRPECARLETAVGRLVSDRVPIAKCIFESDSNPVTDHPYAIFEWIDGDMMDPALANASLPEIEDVARQTGELLAAVGAFTFPESGFLNHSLKVTQPLRMSAEEFKSYVQHDLFHRGAGERLGKELTGALWSFVQTMAPMLDDLDQTPRLVHGDFDGTNLIVCKDNVRWQICGVIDWEYALSATPLVDVGHILRPPFGDHSAFERNFIDAFMGNGGILPPNWKQLSRLLDLLNWVGFPARPAAGPNVLAACRQMILRTMREW